MTQQAAYSISSASTATSTAQKMAFRSSPGGSSTKLSTPS
jgi:hypothetical protein